MRFFICFIVSLIAFAPVSLAQYATWPTAAGGGGGGNNEFHLSNGYLTDESRLPLRQLERMQGVDYLPEYYISPAAVASGTTTGINAASTNNTFIDSSKNWNVNSLVGYRINLSLPSGVNPNLETLQKTLVVTRNNDTTVWFQPDLRNDLPVGTTYEIYDGVLVPGNDTTGNGTKGRPFQTFAAIDEVFSSGGKAVVDCAEFLASRDSGGIYKIQAGGSTLMNGGNWRPENEISAMVTTPVECGSKPSYWNFDTGHHENGVFFLGTPKILNHQGPTGSATDKGPGSITYAIENIVFSGPINPADGKDIIYLLDQANLVTLNLGLRSQKGYFNQLLTNHGWGNIVSLNSKMRTADLSAWKDQCYADDKARLINITAVDGATDVVTSNNHGYEEGETIRWELQAGQGNTSGMDTPGADLAGFTDYAVRNVTTNTFQVGFVFNSNIVDLTGISGSPQGYQIWQACDGANDISGSNYNMIVTAGGGVLAINNDYVLSDSQFSGQKLATPFLIGAPDGGHSWFLWNTASARIDDPDAASAGFMGFSCNALRGNYQHKWAYRCPADTNNDGDVRCPPDTLAGSTQAKNANYTQDEITPAECLFAGNSYYVPWVNGETTGSVAYDANLTANAIEVDGGVGKQEVYLFQNSATNADIFFRGNQGALTVPANISQSVWGACNFMDNIRDHWISIPGATDQLTSIEFSQTVYESGEPRTGDWCVVDTQNDGNLRCNNGVDCAFPPQAGLPICDDPMVGYDNNGFDRTPSANGFEFNATGYTLRSDVVAAGLPFIDDATFFVEQTDRNPMRTGTSRPLGQIPMLKGGGSTVDHTAPGCTSWDCKDQCTTKFKRAWPAEEKVFWTGAFKALIGEEVKGISLNEDGVGNIGSPLTGSGSDLF